MYKAILFDLDGTILNTEKLYYHHFKDQLAQHDILLTKEMFTTQMGTGEKEGAQLMVKHHYPQLTEEQYIQIIGLEKFREHVITHSISADIFPGFYELLDHFQKKLVYAIGTGSSLPILHYFRKQLQLDNYFEAYVSCDEVTHGKPAPDIYLEAAKRISVSPKECIVLEDTPVGVKAGINAGAYTIAIKNEWSEHLDFTMAHYVCSSFYEAQNHIDQLCSQTKS